MLSYLLGISPRFSLKPQDLCNFVFTLQLFLTAPACLGNTEVRGLVHLYVKEHPFLSLQGFKKRTAALCSFHSSPSSPEPSLQFTVTLGKVQWGFCFVLFDLVSCFFKQSFSCLYYLISSRISQILFSALSCGWSNLGGYIR